MSNNISVKKVIAFGFLKLVVGYRGEKYAVVRHVRCGGNLRQNTPAAPPYVTKTIPTNWPFIIPENELRARMEGLREALAAQMQELQKRMVALCHQLGFESFDLRMLPNRASDHFVSRRSGIVGIPIIFELQAKAGFSRQALADPFGRRGFIFVPLKAIRESHLPLPVYPNVIDMLTEWPNADPIATIADSDFTMRAMGLVCSLDVNGYGRLLQASQGSVTVNKSDVQNTVRSEVIRLTSRLLWRLGLPPHQITGDGALFCLPSDGAGVKDLCAAYLEEVCNPLEGWNRRIHTGEASGSVAGSRLVVVQDEFHFGRIAGAESLMAGIDGQSLIDVVRLDAGFKAHLNSIKPPPQVRHFFVSLESFAHSEMFAKDISESFECLTKEGRQLRGRYTPIAN